MSRIRTPSKRWIEMEETIHRGSEDNGADNGFEFRKGKQSKRLKQSTANTVQNTIDRGVAPKKDASRVKALISNEQASLPPSPDADEPATTATPDQSPYVPMKHRPLMGIRHQNANATAQPPSEADSSMDQSGAEEQSSVVTTELGSPPISPLFRPTHRTLSKNVLAVEVSKRTPKKTAPRAAEHAHSSPKPKTVDEEMEEYIIPVPTGDSPMPKEKKELCRSRRRSSFTLRGKRVSSMANTLTAVPHDDLPSDSFYRHIASDLPDPIKISQLLCWSAHRATSEQKADASSLDRNALRIAKLIEGQVLKKLVRRKINTAYFMRDPSLDEEASELCGAGIQPGERLKHPENETNAAIKAKCEDILARNQAEIEAWKEQEHITYAYHSHTLDRMREALTAEKEGGSGVASLNTDLLTPTEAEFAQRVLLNQDHLLGLGECIAHIEQLSQDVCALGTRLDLVDARSHRIQQQSEVAAEFTGNIVSQLNERIEAVRQPDAKTDPILLLRAFASAFS